MPPRSVVTSPRTYASTRYGVHGSAPSLPHSAPLSPYGSVRTTRRRALSCLEDLWRPHAALATQSCAIRPSSVSKPEHFSGYRS